MPMFQYIDALYAISIYLYILGVANDSTYIYAPENILYLYIYKSKIAYDLKYI